MSPGHNYSKKRGEKIPGGTVKRGEKDEKRDKGISQKEREESNGGTRLAPRLADKKRVTSFAVSHDSSLFENGRGVRRAMMKTMAKKR